MQRTSNVKTYFTDRAALFDALYEEQNPVRRSFNTVFRRALFQRYVFTLRGLGSLPGRRVLDVGCGSGRYAVELAKRGADVVGVDFSREMLSLARARATASGIEDRITFLEENFLPWSLRTEERFDASFAMGVFDYVDDPLEFLKGMAKISRGVIASFPAPSPVRMPLRKARYWLRSCPVYFYRRREVEDLYAAAGLKTVTFRRLGFAGYWVHGTHLDNGAG